MLYYQLKTRIKADYTGLETPYLDKMSRLSGAQFNKGYGSVEVSVEELKFLRVVTYLLRRCQLFGTF